RRQQVEAVGLAHADAPHAAQLQRDRVHRPGHAHAVHRPHEDDNPFTSSNLKLRRAVSNGTIPAISGAPGSSKMLVGRWYTPITRKGRPPTLMSRLTGSSGPNRRSTVRCSTMITGAPVRRSAGVNTRPREIPPPRI